MTEIRCDCTQHDGHEIPGPVCQQRRRDEWASACDPANVTKIVALITARRAKETP